MWNLLFTIFSIYGVWADDLDLPLVQTSLGEIRGVHKTSFDGRVFSAFEGIPYAKPPVGDLRFEPPQPSGPWNDTLNANSQYVCKQVESPFIPISASEDCLYLNVYVPNIQPSENDNYHVIVYIHGGAFMMGTSAMNGPKYLIDRDIIYVNLNYRLGILGFLSTEDHVVPGNNGLKDQQLAMKWVQTHIKQFGGNPQSITLMGHSAGGASVHFHYFSPQSKGLFHRGISQSGTSLMPWAIQENALGKTRKLATSLACFNSNTQTLIDCLKGIPVDDLIDKTKEYFEMKQFPLAPFAPVIEANSQSSFLTKHPYHLLEDGDVTDVPWLTWIVKDEGILSDMFTSVVLISTLDELDEHWSEWSEHFFDYKYVCKETTKHEIAQKIKSFYFQNERISKSNVNSLIKVFGDRLFNVGYETAIQMQEQVTTSPIYAGIFAYNKSFAVKELLGIDLEGVCHGAETVLLHDNEFISPLFPDFKLSEAEVLMKNVLIDLVTSFAKDGKPKFSGIDWDQFKANYPIYFLINDFDDVGMVPISELSPKEFWENLDFMENQRSERIRDEL